MVTCPLPQLETVGLFWGLHSDNLLSSLWVNPRNVLRTPKAAFPQEFLPVKIVHSQHPTICCYHVSIPTRWWLQQFLLQVNWSWLWLSVCVCLSRFQSNTLPYVLNFWWVQEKQLPILTGLSASKFLTYQSWNQDS